MSTEGAEEFINDCAIQESCKAIRYLWRKSTFLRVKHVQMILESVQRSRKFVRVDNVSHDAPAFFFRGEAFRHTIKSAWQQPFSSFGLQLERVWFFACSRPGELPFREMMGVQERNW